MTTNNHPAHGPVSLERLHQISEILSKAAAQSDGGNLGYAMADAVKVINGAIAAFGAEHVPCPKCNDTGMADSGGVHPWGEPILIECDCRADTLHDEPVSNSDELPLDYIQGHKDGLEWAAQLAEANHPQTGDWLYDDPIELARAIRKGPDMPEFKSVSVDEDDNFYSWFGRFWYENYQKNNYTTSAKQMLGTMAEFAYRAGRESAALAGNSPVTPDDVLRMDWLVSKTVDVREPMVYGSHSIFWSKTITDEDDDYHATKLREQIDAAMAAEQAAAPQQEVK